MKVIQSPKNLANAAAEQARSESKEALALLADAIAKLAVDIRDIKKTVDQLKGVRR